MRKNIVKYLLITIGTLSLALGITGIFLPLLPTTPFLLLTAACYLRSSQTLYDKLLNNKHLGTYIRNFREYRAIPLRTKIIAISLVWTTILYSAFFVIHSTIISIALIVLAIVVTCYILSFKTLKEKKD